jgi:hypothetical protein
MSRDDYDKAMRQVWAPTMDLRFVFRAIALGDDPPKVRILQQRWIDQLGSSEWRDVPLVDTEAK